MPVVDGAALLAAMSARPDLASVPVVVMSSLPEATIAERCLGYAAILRKPFGIGEVLRLLEQFARSRRRTLGDCGWW